MKINKKYSEMVDHTNVFAKVLWENPLYDRYTKAWTKEQEASFKAVLDCEAILEKNLLKGFCYYVLVDSRIQSDCLLEKVIAEGMVNKKDMGYLC